MLDLWPFWKGLGIGLAVAAPVGPVGLLCIRRSLARGWLSGFLSGLGAAVADAVYAAIAAFGLTTLTSWLVASQDWIAPIGGVLLIWIGIGIWHSKPGDRGAAPVDTAGLAADFATTLAVTMTNPATILSFVALFAGFGLGTASDYGAATLLTVGTFLGSALWWLFLSNASGWARRYATDGRLVWVNRVAGAIIVAFGLWGISAGIR